jgi:hypothetical protein
MSHFFRGITSPVWPPFENDLVSVIFPAGPGFFTTYTRKDGTLLSLRSEEFVLYQAGKPVSMTFEEGSANKAWKWLEEAEKDEIRSLRFIRFEPDKDGGILLLRLPSLEVFQAVHVVYLHRVPVD